MSKKSGTDPVIISILDAATSAQNVLDMIPYEKQYPKGASIKDIVTFKAERRKQILEVLRNKLLAIINP